MIYFVDEETGDVTAYPLALKIKGYEVRTIPDATRALEILTAAGAIDLVIIDVMLARGLDPDGYFPADTTGRGLRTGMRLLDLLCERRPENFPGRAVLLSAATNHSLVSAIEEVSIRLGIPFWRKEHFRVTRDFTRSVIEHLALVGVESGGGLGE